MSDQGLETARSGRLAGLFLLLGLVLLVTAWQMFVLPRDAEARGATDSPRLLLADSRTAHSPARAGTPGVGGRTQSARRSASPRLIHPGTVAEPAREFPDAEASRRNRLYEFIPLPLEDFSDDVPPGEDGREEHLIAADEPEPGGGMPWYFSIENISTPGGSSVESEPAPPAGQGAVEPGSETVQVVVLGPPDGRVGELLTFSVLMEGASGVAHAPLRILYDPDVLEYVIAREGGLFSSDGASTQFYAMQGGIPGQIDVALSRVSPAQGISGSGTLCEVTFRAISEGESPVVLAGSRLMDPTGHPVTFRRNDIYVAIQ